MYTEYSFTFTFTLRPRSSRPAQATMGTRTRRGRAGGWCRRRLVSWGLWSLRQCCCCSPLLLHIRPREAGPPSYPARGLAPCRPPPPRCPSLFIVQYIIPPEMMRDGEDGDLTKTQVRRSNRAKG
eukprot:149896-Pyramimonas_sp.AAC.1